MTIMLTASGILIAFVVGVVGIAQASAKEGGAGTGVTVSPSGVDLPWSGLGAVFILSCSRGGLALLSSRERLVATATGWRMYFHQATLTG
ncbi:hypothetical protein [Streptomyces olivaceus]|uniref:hypothetical protein n=1 Tax=Streptomyces olivaceus TaxID=47716 RepID=UPI00368C6730